MAIQEDTTEPSIGLISDHVSVVTSTAWGRRAEQAGDVLGLDDIGVLDEPTPTRQPRCVLYLRVSTKSQVKTD